MTFLNWTMLFALAAVGIPILIHLLNRRRSRTVEWGAMRFLLASLVSRSRRIMIEEVVLMMIRCLLVALVVLAMARPFLPSRSMIPWAVVLPSVLAAVLLTGVAAAMWSQKRARWAMLGAAAGLVVLAGLAVAAEHTRQLRQWSRLGGQQDVAIIIDGSMSMTLGADERSNFRRAIKEARAVVAACRPADAVSVILAGPVPQMLTPAPTSDRKEIARVLDDLADTGPTGGAMHLLGSMNAAVGAISSGKNPAKRIVIITDGQKVGWSLPAGPGAARSAAARWKFLAANLKDLPTVPQIVCRTLRLPETFGNVAVEDVAFSRKIVGTDREVSIDVKIANTGGEPIDPAGVELTIDGLEVANRPIGSIAPDADETVRFSHHFQAPGRHVIRAKVLGGDDLAGDDEAVRVLNVIDRLGVLVIDGSPSERPLDGAAAFIDIALSPRERDEPKPPPGAAAVLSDLVDPTVIDAPDVAKIEDISAYSVAVLANVPRLPTRFAEMLGKFVYAGGGLLICPGDLAAPGFYALWKGPTGVRMAPGRLIERRVGGEKAASLATETFSHPALRAMADPQASDAAAALIRSYWRLDADADDPSVRIGGQLDTGEPMLLEHRVGRGLVAMTAMSLDRHCGNLPALNCYVPLVHELIYYLAAPVMVDLNRRPGPEITIDLPVRPIERRRLGNALALSQAELAEAVWPSGASREAGVAVTARGVRLTFPTAGEPGLYRVKLAGPLSKTFRRFLNDESVPVAVAGQIAESRIAQLTDSDLAWLNGRVKIVHAQSLDEMTSAVAGTTAGEELWQFLVLGALGALLAEIAVTRWIARRRRTHDVEAISFGAEALDVAGFRAKAREMLTVSSERT